MRKYIVLILGISVAGISSASGWSAEKILFIGDSHVAGPYGAQFEKLFKQKNYKINRVGCVGASTDTFLRGGTLCNRGSIQTGVEGNYRAPQFQRLLKKLTPSTVVISLGANMYSDLGWTPEHRTASARLMAELVMKSGVKKCFWIGPKYGPNKSYDEAGKVMTELASGFDGVCELVDSRKIAEFNWCGEATDFKPCCCKRNAHFNAGRYGKAGPKRAREWANQAFELLMSSFQADSVEGKHEQNHVQSNDSQ